MESVNNATQELKDIYKNYLEPEIKELDNIYHRFLNEKQPKINRYNIISLVIFITLGIPAFLVAKINAEITFGLTFAGITAIAALQFARKQIKLEENKLLLKIRRLYKQNVFGTYCKIRYKDFVYIPHQRMGKKTIQRSSLFENDLFFQGGEDFFRFRIDDIMLQFSEIKISYSQNGQSVPIRNFFVSSDFNKPFKSKTLILKKNKLNKNKTTSLLTGFQGIIGEMEQIKLEASDFNDNFDVFGDSQIESRYILSPSFMSMLVNYKNNKNWKITASFIENRMYMRFDGGKDFFEPTYMNNTFGNFHLLHKDLQMIEDINDMVQALKLNQKIWKV